ncbi:MAG: phage tail protein [Chloroflexaceae bacterium]|nr:phage tail protein [Chloroflexaceae bacterium]
MPQEPFIGEIYLVPYNFAPRGYAFCQGQLLSIAQNSALFALIGTTFGGNGQTTFALPDLRGRVPLGVGQGSGLSLRNLGELAGSETNTLATNQLPSHTHALAGSLNATTQVSATLRGSNALADQNSPQGHALAETNARAGQPPIYTTQSPIVDMQAGSINTTATTTITNGLSISATGSNIPVNNMQPYLGLNYIIALVGIFPSRD